MFCLRSGQRVGVGGVEDDCEGVCVGAARAPHSGVPPAVHDAQHVVEEVRRVCTGKREKGIKADRVRRAVMTPEKV